MAQKARLPRYIADAIRHAWPNGIVDRRDHWNDSPLARTYPSLKERLAGLPGARILFERAPQWLPDSGTGPDEGLRSYCLFFLSPTPEHFEFETETIDPEDETERRIPGQGWMGCMAGISVVAPFAAVRLDEYEVFENGFRCEPDVEPHMFAVGMGKLDLDDHFREMVDEEGLSVLKTLQAGMVRVLEEFGITVIPEEDLDRPVPRRLAGDEAFKLTAGKPITVRRAFFFQGQ